MNDPYVTESDLIFDLADQASRSLCSGRSGAEVAHLFTLIAEKASALADLLSFEPSGSATAFDLLNEDDPYAGDIGQWPNTLPTWLS